MRTRELIVLLLLSGFVLVCGLQPHGGVTRFHHVNQKKSWAEAQRYCREKFTDLASIPSQAANDEAQKEAAGHEFVWVGLYNGGWKWSEGGQVLSWFFNVAASDPASNKCAALSTTKRWMARGCSSKLFFMCSTANNRHVLVRQSMTWSDAQTFCRKNHVDLSSVTSSQDINTMATLLMINGKSGYSTWIGLYREKWVWSDGKTDTYRPWKTMPASTEDCMVMDTSSGSWTPQSCNKKHSFLCYSVMKPSTSTVVKVRLTGGSADLTDPAVQESILEQLRQRLLDAGITEQVKLRWRKQPDGEVFHAEEETAPPADHQDVCRAV